MWEADNCRLESEVNMARPKKVKVEETNVQPSGWVEGSMPEPVRSLPTAPDPRPTPKEADPDPVIEKPVKAEKKAKAKDGFYKKPNYTGHSLIEALRLIGEDPAFLIGRISHRRMESITI